MFTERFSVIFDLGYLAGAKTEASGSAMPDGEKIYRDISGINVGLSVKVYLF